MNDLIVVGIAVFAVMNILRMSAYLIGADIYDLRQHRREKRRAKQPKGREPMVTVMIPAHNEEKVIIRAIKSVMASDYSRFRIIVVDDGSTDSTYATVRKFIDGSGLSEKVKLIYQENAGKGHALNNGIRKHVRSKLVMVLDADSAIASDAISKAVKYFEDPHVVALCANIKIMPDKRIMGLIQEYEYLISNRIRKSYNVINSEYVIGGVGSMFRRDVLKKVGFYDTDTITEDLDLTFKIIKLGNKKHRITYGADVNAYTEGVMTFGALIRQRFRWKYGRYQAYLKHRSVIFNRQKKYDKRLTLFMLPYTIFMDIVFFFEPLVFMLFVGLAFFLNGDIVILNAYLLITAYVGWHLILDKTITRQRKLVLLLLAPVLYFLLFIASIVEYMALIRSVFKLPNLRLSIAKGGSAWQHVERSGQQQI